ncbi:MAG: hypothetical protein HYV03_07025 [Deltaproteobacteria bacterium]|nr:hypothetical protein [Deltaproteobacteria bacterium]
MLIVPLLVGLAAALGALGCPPKQEKPKEKTPSPPGPDGYTSEPQPNDRLNDRLLKDGPSGRPTRFDDRLY